jgi:hypothetical protein
MPLRLAGKTRIPALDRPYPLPDTVITLVIRAIDAAWRYLLAMENIDLAACNEDEISELLRGVLEEGRSGVHPLMEGFDARVFSAVERCASLSNYNGRKINKAPDIIIRLQQPRAGIYEPLYGIFVESKIVDRGRSFCKEYCKDGLQRFVDGDYAWTMRDAVMAAYVRIRKPYPDSLAKCLSVSTGKKDPYHTRQPPTPTTLTIASGPVCTTRHHRPWRFHDTDHDPGPIRLWHLWLQKLT